MQFFSFTGRLVRGLEHKIDSEKEKSVRMLSVWRTKNHHPDPYNRVVGLRVAPCALALGMLLAASVFAGEPGFGEYRAVQESLARVHPRMRAMAV